MTDEETTDDDTTEEHDSYSGRSLFSHLPTEKNVLLPYQERRRSFEPNIISDSSNDEEEEEHELMADKDEGFESVRVSVARIRLAFKRLVGWRDMTSFDKALFVVTSPIWLLFNVTIPCVELEGYNRVFSSLCAIFSPLLVLNRSNPIQSNPIDQVVVRPESVSLQSKRARTRLSWSYCPTRRSQSRRW